ncbi:MAG: hypothetical protein AAF998_13390 [Bacteroidota bacterium]
MSQYQEFLRLEIAHDYFAPAAAPDLVVRPTPATTRYLAGRGGLLKGTLQGFRLLLPAPDAIPNPRFGPDDRLTFQVFPESDTFNLITDLPASGHHFHFTNQEFKGAAGTLRATSRPGSGSHRGFPLAAQIDLHLADAEAAAEFPVRYRIAFPAQSEIWKYYFVAEKNTTDLRVEDREAKLTFHAVDATTLATDRVGKSLRTNYPDANLFLFESTHPIAGSVQGRKNLQLLREGHVIIPHLPNPDVRDAAMRIIKL